MKTFEVNRLHKLATQKCCSGWSGPTTIPDFAKAMQLEKTTWGLQLLLLFSHDHEFCLGYKSKMQAAVLS